MQVIHPQALAIRQQVPVIHLQVPVIHQHLHHTLQLLPHIPQHLRLHILQQAPIIPHPHQIIHQHHLTIHRQIPVIPQVLLGIRQAAIVIHQVHQNILPPLLIILQRLHHLLVEVRNIHQQLPLIHLPVPVTHLLVQIIPLVLHNILQVLAQGIRLVHQIIRQLVLVIHLDLYSTRLIASIHQQAQHIPVPVLRTLHLRHHLQIHPVTVQQVLLIVQQALVMMNHQTKVSLYSSMCRKSMSTHFV